VSQPIRNHLKLYNEPRPAAPPPASSFATLPALLDAFHQATGWSLEYTSPASPTSASATADEGPELTLALASNASHAIPFESAHAFASALGQLLGEAIGLEQALWHREAELATAVPVIPAANERQHLAERLEAVLKGGAEAIGCHAAALYLLDEATSELKLRAAWGLPRARLVDAARPLRGAVADLEALLGSAVALESEAMMAPWHAPEQFAAAVCVPVSSATTILGTLWVFSRRARRFNDRHTNLVEIIAGRLAAELEREILLSQGIDAARWRSQIATAENLQREHLPSTSPHVDGWQLAGWTEQAQPLGGDFFDWFCRSDDSVVVVLGDADGQGIPAALTASALKAALRSHALHPTTPEQILTHANVTLWTGSAGDQQAAALVALLKPNDGRVSYSGAGPVHLLVLASPEGDLAVAPSPRLGGHPESVYTPHEINLRPGQIAVLFTDGFCQATGDRVIPFGPAEITAALSGHLDQSARTLAQLLRDRLAPTTSESHPADRTILILKRIDP
jgi:sigma-B regulation protein RsbU (phosphoserine phosphatase)